MPQLNEREELIRTKQCLAPEVARWMHAYWECSDKVQAVVRDMVEILRDEEADDDDKEMAVATLLEALFPSRHNGELGADLEELESLHSQTSEVGSIVATMDEQEVTFARKVMELMEAKQMTQGQLATAIGVQQPAISMLMSRASRPQKRTVQKIAQALGVEVDLLWPLTK